MFKRILRRGAPAKRYNFYVWENGSYVSVNGGEFPSDEAAALRALRKVEEAVPSRPASLDAPHLHVVREDGVHIITVELPEAANSNGVAGPREVAAS